MSPSRSWSTACVARLVVGGVMLAALLQMIDMTIVNVSLPTIQGNLGATIDEATWVITAYVVANIVVIPITPWLQRSIPSYSSASCRVRSAAACFQPRR